jgi:uncharacterized membrane protein
VLNMGVSFVPLGSLVVGGPLAGGVIAVALRIAAGRPVEFSNMFDGFKRFLPLMLAQLVMVVLVGIGMVFLILPGIYLAIVLGFGLHLVVDRDEEFWPALMGSMKVVQKNLLSVFLVGLAVGLVLFVASIPLGLGLLVAGPWAVMVSAVLYRKLFGIAGGAERMGVSSGS